MGVSGWGLGLGRWYHLLVIGASFVARFDKTVSQLIALTETTGNRVKLGTPAVETTNAGRRYAGFLSTSETAGGQN